MSVGEILGISLGKVDRSVSSSCCLGCRLLSDILLFGAVHFFWGGVRPNRVGILWRRYRAPRSGHLTRTHSHLLTLMIRCDQKDGNMDVREGGAVGFKREMG